MSKVSHVAPQCIAFVVCDAVIEDKVTQNKSLINIFNGIKSTVVPVRHDKMCVFASFTGGRGPVPIVFRLCHSQDYEADILHMGGTVEFPNDNPHAVVDLVCEIRGLRIEKFGIHIFEVVIDGVPVATRRIDVCDCSQAAK